MICGKVYFFFLDVDFLLVSISDLRRLPLEEQLRVLQARFDDVSSGKHSIGRSRRAKTLRKEMTVIKRKLAHQRDGGSSGGNRESGASGERGSNLAHHASGGACHDEGGESSSQEISGKGGTKYLHTLQQYACSLVGFSLTAFSNVSLLT